MGDGAKGRQGSAYFCLREEITLAIATCSVKVHAGNGRVQVARLRGLLQAQLVNL